MHSQMPGVCPVGGMLKFRIDRCIKPIEIFLNACSEKLNFSISMESVKYSNKPAKMANCVAQAL